MAKLEDLKRNSQVKGLNPSGIVTILNVQQHGSDVFEVTYRDLNGKDLSEILFRDREVGLEVTEAGTPWAFDSDGELFRLVSEAYRIRMAYLFDPWAMPACSNSNGWKLERCSNNKRSQRFSYTRVCVFSLVHLPGMDHCGDRPLSTLQMV